MVSTLDFESSDPSSSLGGTLTIFVMEVYGEAILRVQIIRFEKKPRI